MIKLHKSLNRTTHRDIKRSLNKEARYRELQRIEESNQELLLRLLSKRSEFSRSEMRRDWKKHTRLVLHMSQFARTPGHKHNKSASPQTPDLKLLPVKKLSTVYSSAIELDGRQLFVRIDKFHDQLRFSVYPADTKTKHMLTLKLREAVGLMDSKNDYAALVSLLKFDNNTLTLTKAMPIIQETSQKHDSFQELSET